MTQFRDARYDVPEDDDHPDAVKILYEHEWWKGRALKRVPSGVKVQFTKDGSFMLVLAAEEDTNLRFLRESSLRNMKQRTSEFLYEKIAWAQKHSAKVEVRKMGHF